MCTKGQTEKVIAQTKKVQGRRPDFDFLPEGLIDAHERSVLKWSDWTKP